MTRLVSPNRNPGLHPSHLLDNMGTYTAKLSHSVGQCLEGMSAVYSIRLCGGMEGMSPSTGTYTPRQGHTFPYIVLDMHEPC